jgi:hypothetical protein
VVKLSDLQICPSIATSRLSKATPSGREPA